MAAKRASSAFQEFETESKGRGLRSLKKFSPGDQIFRESPVVFVLSNKVRGQRCDSCFVSKSELLRCSKCKFARYCNVRCQRTAWKEHKGECKRLDHVSPRVPTDLVLLMYRILQRKVSKSDDSTFYDLLVSNVDEIDEERRSEFAPVFVVLDEYAGKELIEQFASTEVFELFGKISCNSFSICSGEMQPIGVGIYSGASLLNHSCSPNCVAVFDGTELIINAVGSIKAEEELTISYTELLRPSDERRSELWNQYCFDCTCPRCLNSQREDELLMSWKCPKKGCSGLVQGKCDHCGETPDYINVKASERHAKLKETLHEIKSMEKYKDFEDILKVCEKMLGNFPDISPYNYLGIQLLDKAFDACVELEKWEQALEYGLKNVDPYMKLYPKYHPSVGILHYKIGKLESLVGSLVSGVQSLQQAQVILENTHGKTHPLVQELHEYLAQASEELRVERQQGSKN